MPRGSSKKMKVEPRQGTPGRRLVDYELHGGKALARVRAKSTSLRQTSETAEFGDSTKMMVSARAISASSALPPILECIDFSAIDQWLDIARPERRLQSLDKGRIFPAVGDENFELALVVRAHQQRSLAMHPASRRPRPCSRILRKSRADKSQIAPRA